MSKGFWPAKRPRRTPVQTDLFVRRGPVLAVVEVKYRQNPLQAAMAISPQQAKRLKAEARRMAARYPAYTLRIDAVQVFPLWPFVRHEAALIPLD